MDYFEIETCVAKAKSGSEEELMKIIEQYKPFIIKTAKEFNIRNCDTHDLLQIGYMAIINAVDKYKTGSNTFSTYVFNSVKNALRYTARQHSRFEAELSFNTVISPEDNFHNEFINTVPSLVNLEDEILNIENSKELRRVVDKLPPGEAELLFSIYYKGVSIRSYAEKEGISYQKALRKRDHILLKLNNFFKNKPVN